MEEEVLMACQDCQPDPIFSIEIAFSATITGPLYPLGPVNDLRNWLIDLGATSHFNPHPEDLRELEPCQIDVTVRFCRFLHKRLGFHQLARTLRKFFDHCTASFYLQPLRLRSEHGGVHCFK